jgi:UDP-N-acetylmuramoylalanine--D-glutamate ligase
LALNSAALVRLERLRDARIGVLGLGREGVDLVRFLAPWTGEIVVSDRQTHEQLAPAIAALAGVQIRYHLGGQLGSDVADCQEIFLSPGVAPTEPIVAEAAAAGVRISSATRLFFELCPGPIVGITGSSGKTTTTTLVGTMLAEAGIPSVVGGNIGRPMLGRLAELDASTWSVLELSSFQLADMTQSPTVAAILNITPNHLDRHPDMEDYIRAKANIIRYQSIDDCAILNADDPIVASLDHASPTLQFSLNGQVNGAWREDDAIWLAINANSRGTIPPTRVLHRSEIPLQGDHNVANTLAAVAIASAVGCDVESLRRAIRQFRPVPHRLEVVATIDGVTYVNDSIATSPERSMAALRAIDTPIVLIAGGRDKHTPMEDWARLMQTRVRAVVLVGEAAPLIREAIASANTAIPLLSASRFAETVALASSAARPGDTVLLSPGCTSFDAFRDYEARGVAFRELVHELGQARSKIPPASTTDGTAPRST